MTNERTEYVEKLMKFVIGEEVKVERTKGQKDTTPVLGTGHLADGKGTVVKEGKREYASGNISKSVKKAKGVSGETKKVLVTLIQMIDDYTPNLSNSELRYLVNLMLNHGHSLDSAKEQIREHKDRANENPSASIPFEINRG